jgi:hypothetical protein
LRDDTIPQTVLFPALFNAPVVATFDQSHASSDGGAIVLKAAEARYGLIDGFARCLVDGRQPGKVRHTLADLLAQRIYGLACGHPDVNLPQFNRRPISHESAIGVCHGETEASVVLSGV